MAVYNSKYSEFSFYVNGNHRSFKNGRYTTENKDEIKVLDALSDAVKVDDPAKDTANKEAKPQNKRVTSRDKAPEKKKESK